MITSIHNPKVQEIRKLQAMVKVRAEEHAFIIEGVRLAEEALRSGWDALQVLYASGLDPRGIAVVNAFASRGVPVDQVADSVMKAISETESPQGLLVSLRMHALPIPATIDFVLVLDGIRDPGNLGTILRTASAAGVQAVFLVPGTADAFSPKVLRAGMGAHFRLPIQHVGWDEVKMILKDSSPPLKVYLADSGEGGSHTQVSFRQPFALIIGGEAVGAGREALALADEKVHIPMPGGNESLNAAVAAGVLLFEAVRQRG